MVPSPHVVLDFVAVEQGAVFLEVSLDEPKFGSSGVAGIICKHLKELDRTSVLFKMSAFASGVVDLGKGIVIKVCFQSSIHNSDNLGKWPPFMTGRLKVTFVSKFDNNT